MRCWNHKVENFHKDLKKTLYKSRVWLGTERPSTFTSHPRLIFVLRSHNSMPIRCWHKVRNFYKETGKLSKRLFDLRWSLLTTFTKARIHNMWQECKNVAKIFQRGGGGHTLSNKWNSPVWQENVWSHGHPRVLQWKTEWKTEKIQSALSPTPTLSSHMEVYQPF